ncbi:outer membrane lipoprotein-sorting protein [Sagittula sp. NFXS13]|uniref:outer membrane lipoprotein-sorting protein n=1 Tax=Sagittula sp. NFXS13 TaxID=2819095 RepID=UPI0032DF2008
MFNKQTFRRILTAAAFALLPAMSFAGAKDDILEMGLYRGFDQAAFTFDTQITAYVNNKPKGSSQVATVYYRSTDATLVAFKSPATFAGRRILTEGNSMWMVLPTSSRTIRVSADDRLMGQASNGDILNIPVEKYSYAYNGTETVNGKTYKRIVAKLSRGSAMYSRVDFLLAEGSNKPFRSYHFSGSGKLLKIAQYAAFRNFAGHERVTKIALIDPIVKSNVTVMHFDNYRQRNLPQAMFRKSALRNAINF